MSWILPRQSHRVLTLATAQFQDQGMVVPEYLVFPLSLEPVIFPVHFLERRLEDPVECVQLPEFR
jgi:hypothetical protein